MVSWGTGDGVRVSVDPDHGGRWTSLRGPGPHEWLGRRDAAGRADVRPGDPFVDAGGFEECFPTLGGPPDHGDVWTRRWRSVGDSMVVEGADYQLRRRMSARGRTLTASYHVTAAPGFTFIWAGHAFLDLSVDAWVAAPHGHVATVHDGQVERWAQWPELDGTDMSRFGPPDGTVLMIVLRDLSEATVMDGPDRLTMSVTCAEAPTSIAVWRNLYGWPDGVPYRSICVEPLIGRVGALSIAGPGDAAVVGPSGSLTWTLTVTVGADR
jgi:hypothetical protein